MNNIRRFNSESDKTVSCQNLCPLRSRISCECSRQHPELIPQTNVENENDETEQLITHELEEISSPSVSVVYEARENEAENPNQLTSSPQPQTPSITQSKGKDDQQSAPITTLHTPPPRFPQFLRREVEPNSRRSTPNVVGCDELVVDSNGAGDPSEHTEGQPDVVPVVESSAQSDQRVTVTRQEDLTLTNMLERIPCGFFNLEKIQSSGRHSLNVVADPPVSPV